MDYDIVKNRPRKTCTLCGSTPVERTGKYGKFLSCPNWPKCDGEVYDKINVTIEDPSDPDEFDACMDRPF